MGSRRCDSNISALRLPSVWRISIICLIARLHLVATDQIPVCALKDLQLEMVSDLKCTWSNGSCSSLEECSTKQIICDLNNTQVSIACRIIYERKGQKCIKLTGTSKDKLCFYSNKSRIHDMEGCINDSSVTCSSDYKCDSECRAYALGESPSGQEIANSSKGENKSEDSDAVSAWTVAIIVSAVLLLLAVVAAVLFLKFKYKTLQKSYSNCDLRAEEHLEIHI